MWSPQPPLEPEAVAPDRREVLAARGDLDVVADPVEECGDRAADGARPDHPDSHASSVRA